MQAIQSTRPGGSVGYVGVPHGVELDGEQLFYTPRAPARRPRAGAPLPAAAHRSRAERQDRSRQGLRPDAAARRRWPRAIARWTSGARSRRCCARRWPESRTSDESNRESPGRWMHETLRAPDGHRCHGVAVRARFRRIIRRIDGNQEKWFTTVGKRTCRVVHRNRPDRSVVRRAVAGTRHWCERHVRTGRPDGVAHAPTWSDADRDVRCGRAQRGVGRSKRSGRAMSSGFRQARSTGTVRRQRRR